MRIRLECESLRRALEMEAAGAELPEGAGQILFRVPTMADLWKVAGSMQTLPVDGVVPDGAEDDEVRVVADPDADVDARAEGEGVEQSAAEMAEVATAFLVQCSISPRLITEDPVVIPEGCFPVSEIEPDERIEMSLRIQGLAGYTRETTEAIAPLSETESPCDGSTSSEPGTESAPQ